MSRASLTLVSGSRDEKGAPDDPAPKMSLWERFRYAVVVPDDDTPSKKSAAAPARSVEEIQAEVKSTSEKERAIGLIVAPLGAAVGFVIIDALTHHGKSPGSTYETLFVVVVALSALIMAGALLRKRMILGVGTTLVGLDVFNLHYWGFGVPFVMVGAWYLVRSYRLGQELKAAGGGPSRSSGAAKPGRPRANKRYTPPA